MNFDIGHLHENLLGKSKFH